MNEIGDKETTADKKLRLRAARLLAEEERQEEADSLYALRIAAEKSSRGLSGREIYFEYAKQILEVVLKSPEVKPILFGEGTSEAGKAMRAKVLFAVGNMADELTKKHLHHYP